MSTIRVINYQTASFFLALHEGISLSLVRVSESFERQRRERAADGIELARMMGTIYLVQQTRHPMLNPVNPRLIGGRG